MSVQIFLQAKLVGIEEFLLSPIGVEEVDAFLAERYLAGRSHWVSLLMEILPRAILSELGLAKILLGASGGEQFLVVLPSEAREQAESMLGSAAAEIGRMSNGHLRLIGAITENLGDWSDVRRRLNEEMQRKRGACPETAVEGFFAPYVAQQVDADVEYFAGELGEKLRETDAVSWSPESPARVMPGSGGKFSWPLTSLPDSIPLARHAAPSEDGHRPADCATLASRAQGRQIWGVLRGDVDNFAVRLRRAQSIEEHIQLSVMYKQFFAGELEVLCSMGEFWRKVTVLYAGGDDFAVYGAWDALIALAREIQRLFRRLSEENLKEYPGPEGKTLSMALALPNAACRSLRDVYEEAGRQLALAKAATKDAIQLFGRTVEWKHLGSAAESRDILTRMVTEFGCPPRFLGELAGFYKEQSRKLDRPWRFHRRVNRVVSEALEKRGRDRELEKLRTNLIIDLIGKNAAQIKLRPAGRVALEWARLSIED